MPSTFLLEECQSVDVAWQGGGVTVTDDPVPFAEVSAASDEMVDQAAYTIEEQNGEATLVTTDRKMRVLFSAREPSVLATFPPGYLATTVIFRDLIDARLLGTDYAGLQFISDAVTPFGLSAMYAEEYPINAAFVIDPTDPENGYEGWLYDRCTTFLSFYVHTGDTRFLRESYRLCSYYADHIELNGENRGIFTGKADPDPKYSHLHGLYAYYALTGDEAAHTAGVAIAEMFVGEQFFVAPYRAGHLRGIDKLWTERQLSYTLEALTYGFLLTDDVAYLTAASEMVGTAHRHITGDAATLAEINPGSPAFPPQNCFIHTAEQAAEGNADEPWCSGWMPALLINPLLAYQSLTDDPRVDEIFVRLTRYLRDTGAAYFDPANGNADDTFLAPTAPFVPEDLENPRALVPLYGAAVGVDGQRDNSGEYDDYQHCPDVTAITAAGIRALKRMGTYDQNPIGPFASEGESFLALHEEFAYCSAWVLDNDARPHRNPATWTAEELADGLSDPATFIADNNIANISHNVNPKRKISWWFNAALMQFQLLLDAGVSVPELRAGSIAPGNTGPTPTVGAAVVATMAPVPTIGGDVTAEAGSRTTVEPAIPTPETTGAIEGGAAADGLGQVVFFTGGTLYRMDAVSGAVPENLSTALDEVAPFATSSGSPPDRWGGVSADGQWLLLMTERVDPDCAGWACLVLMGADLSSPEAVRVDGEVVHPSNVPAIASGGNLIVYVEAGGPNAYDLWATHRDGEGWSSAVLLSGDSPYPYHGEPAFSADGSTVVFTCGNHQYAVDNTAVCEVGADGTGFRVVAAPDGGPSGSPATAALRHPTYAPDGAIVFEAHWTGPAIWRIVPDAAEPELISTAFGIDHLPCVLPDGRIASLWQGRPDNSDSLRELKVMTADGSAYSMLVTGANIEDITCGA
jgi:hypothetical protein